MWRAVFLLTFKTNVCTKEYEVSRAQGIVLDFEFLRGCLGNKEGLSLEVCETLGNKKQNDSHLLHSITQLNQTPFQPAGMLLVCCESGGAALISMDSPYLPPHPHPGSAVILRTAKPTFFQWEMMPIQTSYILTNAVALLPSITSFRISSLEGNGTDYGWL